ncbi:MAG: signal peptide peptidase SppA [Eubacteriales bacterium]|nr:signal peptide peptidase SppA [Eubacteriales bacterium]
MAEIREYDIEEIEANKKNNKNRRKKSLIIFGCIIAGIVGLALIGSFVKGKIVGEGGEIPAKGPYIATLYVKGTIADVQTDSFGIPIGYQHDWTLKMIDDISADSNNRGLILFVDSPGGGVYESDELYLKLKDYRENTGRPIYAVMGSMATSGGYYISAPADKIIANRNTWTGSLGVTIGTLYDISRFLEKYGINTVTITAGDNKAMGSMVDPLTEEQRAIFQSLVDDAYAQFINIISEERGIGLEEVRTLADGRIYTAKQALELQLIDDIGNIEYAVGNMKNTYKLQDCEVIDVVYKDNSLLGSLLGEVKIPDMRSSDVTALLSIIEGDSKFPISYECEILK